MRSLTIDSRTFAEAEIQNVTLHPVIGAYELWFALNIKVGPRNDGRRFRAVFDSMRIRVKARGGQYNDLGFAHAERRIEIDTGKPSGGTQILCLPLQPGQIVAMEKLRDTDDLSFELFVNGRGFVSGGEKVDEHYFQDTLDRTVPRSQWIETLRAGGFRNILLIEVPLPHSERFGQGDKIYEYVLQAESQFYNGDCRACVATCRTITDELGYRKSGNRNWANESLDRFASGRKNMSKEERDLANLAALRHYAHPAHHGPSEGGEANYTRADAEHALALAASFVARWLSE